MDHVKKLIALLLLASVAQAAPHPYYDKGTFPPYTLNMTLSSRPTTAADCNSVSVCFTGDLSHQPLSIPFTITGAATLGQPTSGYLYTEEAAMMLGYFRNESGFNNSTSGAGSGRTGATAIRMHVSNAGQGDAVAYNCSGFVTGTKAAYTGFLANPAVVCFNGDMSSDTDGDYLNFAEFDTTDNGHDLAAIGLVINDTRTNTTGAASVWHQGVRVQSKSTGAMDVGFSGSGNIHYLFDCTQATLVTDGSCLSMKADQKIYFKTTVDTDPLGRYPSSAGNTYFGYNTANVGLLAVVLNSSTLLLTQNNQYLYKNVVLGADLNNRWQFVGAADSGNPTLSLTGASDSNVSGTLTAKGNGTWSLTNGDGTQFQVGDTASAVNYVRALGGATGATATLINAGSDTNGAGLNITVAGKAASAAGVGGFAKVVGGAGNGASAGGETQLTGGQGGTTGAGGAVRITAGAGGATSGNGGSIIITPGATTSGSAGTIQLVGDVSLTGTATGAGYFPAFTGDVTKSSNSQATTVTALNGTSLGGLATGLIKNTTSTGVPVIVPGFPVMFGVASQAQATTTYYAPGGTGSSSAVGAISPMAGTFKNLYIKVATSPASGQTYAYTLYVNQLSTGVTCTITGNVAVTCNDTTHTAAITAGQPWALQVVTSATSGGSGQQMVGLELDP